MVYCLSGGVERAMSLLPDELWRRILEIGVDKKTIDYKSLCCISITCRRFRRLGSDDSLWSALLLADFPSFVKEHDLIDKTNNKTISKTGIPVIKATSSPFVDANLKSLYKVRYEKDRQQKHLSHRRAVLRIESEIAEHSRKIMELQARLSEERNKMINTNNELVNLRRSRQASVALNVWQPEIVRGRQMQLLEQSNVPTDFRIKALEMELNLCKEQITVFDKSLKVQKKWLDAAKEKLTSVKYHPLKSYTVSSRQPNEHRPLSKKSKHS